MREAEEGANRRREVATQVARVRSQLEFDARRDAAAALAARSAELDADRAALEERKQVREGGRGGWVWRREGGRAALRGGWVGRQAAPAAATFRATCCPRCAHAPPELRPAPRPRALPFQEEAAHRAGAAGVEAEVAALAAEAAALRERCEGLEASGRELKKAATQHSHEGESWVGWGV